MANRPRPGQAGSSKQEPAGGKKSFKSTVCASVCGLTSFTAGVLFNATMSNVTRTPSTAPKL
jgi:hypothetical protein